jgi:hypothetical protein
MSRAKSGLDTIPQSTVTNYDSQSGISETVKTIYAGTTAQADALAAGRAGRSGARAESWTVENIGGDTWQLTQKFPLGVFGGSGSGGAGVDDPTVPLNDIWELQSNTVEKDILESDIAAVAELTSKEVNTLQDAVAKYNGYTTADPTFTSTHATTMLKLYHLMVAKVTSVRVFQPTIRHTRIVRGDYTIKDALTNCGKVISSASFAAYENPPGVLLFQLPSGTTVTRDGATLSYGFYKHYPQVNQVADARWQLVQEWEFGLWANDLYTVL